MGLWLFQHRENLMSAFENAVARNRSGSGPHSTPPAADEAAAAIHGSQEATQKRQPPAVPPKPSRFRLHASRSSEAPPPSELPPSQFTPDAVPYASATAVAREEAVEALNPKYRVNIRNIRETELLIVRIEEFLLEYHDRTSRGSGGEQSGHLAEWAEKYDAYADFMPQVMDSVVLKVNVL
jgi:hypothetical protein